MTTSKIIDKSLADNLKPSEDNFYPHQPSFALSLFQQHSHASTSDESIGGNSNCCFNINTGTYVNMTCGSE